MFNARRYRKKRTTKPRRKVVRKAAVRRGKFGNPRAMGPSNNNYAKLVETIEYENCNPNTIYSALVTLADTTRALNLAANFQFYRITAVEWKIKSLFNTFQDSISTTVSSPSKPELYWVMNRNGAFQATNLDQLVQQGSIARAMDKDNIHKYKPNTVVSTGINGTDGTSLTANIPELKFNAWLPTTAVGSVSGQQFNVPYYGHQFYINQEIPTQAANTEVASLEVRIVVEFKGPQQSTAIGPVSQLVKKA